MKRKHGTTMLAGAIGLGLVFWFLITPANPLTAWFSGRITEVDSRVVIGPYPLERDFRVLKQNRVTTLVSLLDPRLPYEKVLLEREQKWAAAYGLRLLNFPMSSIKRVGEEYQRRAAEAAEAVLKSEGKVYVHCYLGIHRVKAVKDHLNAAGESAAQYAVRQGQRSHDALILDRAQSEFEAGKYSDVLQTLKESPERGTAARLLEAWSYYRMGNAAPASAIFDSILEANPGNLEAHSGMAYSALRQNNYAVAEKHFSTVLAASPNDAAALAGMGLARYRQGRIAEAATFLEKALANDPSNTEARQILARIQPSRVTGAAR